VRVCMYVYMYVRVDGYVFMCVCIHTSLYGFTCVCMYVFLQVRVCVFIHVCIYLCRVEYIYECMYLCMYVCIRPLWHFVPVYDLISYIHTFIQKCTRTYSHIDIHE